MPDLLWCALAGLVAGAVVSAPVWLWAWRRQRQRAQESHCRARLPGTAVLSRDTGWFPWVPHLSVDIDHSPYAHRQVEIARDAWNGSQRVDPRTLDPSTNVVDLWWRPVQDDA